jgi:acetoin utilization deacetylase AcuC-like enzyme
VVAAAERIWLGELINAFAFIGAGGHHAGRDFFGGYCCFNDVAIAIERLREMHGVRRVAILDTDAHHGDGTRDIYRDDPAVLHVCLCGSDYASADGTKVDVAVYRRCLEAGARSDEVYLEAAEAALAARAGTFCPDLLVWYFGFDGHRGDYGDLGLTAACYNGLVGLTLALSGQVCGGRLLVVLGGGSRADLASSLIPPIIARLADAAR